MRYGLARTIAFATLSLGLAATASAQDRAGLNPGLLGAGGYTETRSVLVPSAPPAPPVAVVAAAVGRYDFEFDGTFSGAQLSSAGGAVSADVKRGTYTVNPDGTGTLTIRIYDSSGTYLRRTSVWTVVLVDDATEFRGVMTSMVLPNGVSLSPIMTMTGKRLGRDRGNGP